MKFPTKEDLRTLAQTHTPRCLSFYLPTFKTGKDTLANPTRLKNLIRLAKGKLQQHTMEKGAMEEFLRPVTELLEDYDFWQHQEEGLAIFLNEDVFKYYKLPFSVNELVEVTDSFHLKPLIYAVALNAPFYILNLHQKNVDLYRGNRYSLEKLQLDSLPHSLDEILGNMEWEKGHQRNRLLQFFQQIDRGLHPLLKEEKTPLILAGVDYYFPIYREANTYPHLYQEMLTTNHGDSSLEELRKGAWDKLSPFFHKEQENAHAAINEGLTKGLASTDLKKVIHAAVQGRVHTCFVAMGEERWGSFDEATNKIRLYDDNTNGSRDLLDLAAVQTLAHGGQVFPVNQKEIPGGQLVAALMRY